MNIFENTRQINTPLRYQAHPNRLKWLIAQLGDSNGLNRQQSRIALVKMGEPAVDALIEALGSRVGPTRWEAAKALSRIGSPKAALALVEALEDDQFSVRWLAAEGLIALGRKGLKPLLNALAQTPDSIRLREGAHHILYDLVSRESLDEELSTRLQPVLEALNYLNPAVVLPPTIAPALKMLH